MSFLAEKFTHFKLGLKNPMAAMRYVFRKKLWLKELKITKTEINACANELVKDSFLEYLSGELNQDMFNVRQIELYLICRLLKPEIVVETGVQRGISTTLILWALNKNKKGRLYSIEILEHLPNGRRPGWLVPADVRGRWKLIIGNSLEFLPGLLESCYVDIFIHDSEHSYETMMTEYNLAWRHIKPGGLLLSDDTGRNEAFIDFCKRVEKKPLWTERGYGMLKRTRVCRLP